jgi:hypothetical protein
MDSKLFAWGNKPAQVGLESAWCEDARLRGRQWVDIEGFDSVGGVVIPWSVCSFEFAAQANNRPPSKTPLIVIRLIKNAAQQLNSQTDNIESCASTTSGKISNSLIGRSRFHFTATRCVESRRGIDRRQHC